jgi:hypothetical protein
MEPTSNVRVFAPEGGDMTAFLEGKAGAAAIPFSEERLAVMDLLSREILATPGLRADPASVALAYWMRKASTSRLKEQFQTRSDDRKDAVVVPCGRVFHITPANVDTIFVYSWALSFLCGNRNVVRLSSKTSGVVELILSAVRSLMKSQPLLAQENFFVQYDRGDAGNEIFSSWCSHRVVWGGDDTVAAIRQVKLNPQASERSFASKYSWSILSAEAYLNCEAPQRTKLAAAFFNDVFWFDQMACSSPQVVFWVGGSESVGRAREMFDSELQALLDEKRWQDQIALAVRRRNFAFSLSVLPHVEFDRHQRGFSTVYVPDWKLIQKGACGGGFIIHTRAECLDEIVEFAGDGDQSVTHFGFADAELKKFALQAGGRGVDRIVPVGEALNFHHLWDGFDLLQDFTRMVFLKH